MKATMILAAAALLAGCTISNWPGTRDGYGYPGNYGYGYPGYGRYGYPGYGYYGGGPGFNGYTYGYNRAREEDWRRWQAYQYGLSQGKQQARQPDRDGQSRDGGGNRGADKPARKAQLPYGITRNRGGTYHVPGYGDFTAGQIQHYVRKRRR